MIFLREEVLRAMPDDTMTDSGPRTRVGLPTIGFTVLLVPAALWCLSAAFEDHHLEKHAVPVGIAGALLAVLAAWWLWRSLSWKHPLGPPVDVLRGVLQFHIPTNTHDVAVACFCRPDTAPPGAPSTLLLFLQNHAARSRRVTFQLLQPKTRARNSSSRIRLHVAPGQVTVYRVPFLIPVKTRGSRWEIRCRIRIEAPGGRGELLDPKALGVPFGFHRTRRTLRPSVLLTPPGESSPESSARDGSGDEERPLPPPAYLSVYSPESGLRLAVLQRLVLGSPFEAVGEKNLPAVAPLPDVLAHPAAAARARFPFRLRNTLSTAVVLSGALLLLLTALPVSMLGKMREKRDWNRQSYINVLDQPARPMPAHWAEAPPWPPPLLRAAEEVERGWRRIPQSDSGLNGEIAPFRKLAAGAASMSTDEVTTARALLARHGTWADQVAALTSHTGYEIDLFNPPPPLKRAGGHEAHLFAVDLLVLRAELHALEGRFPEAFREVHRIGLLARIHRSPTFIGSLMASAAVSRAARALHRVACLCSDPGELRRGLALCGHPLRPAPLESHPSPYLSDPIATLRSMKQEGFPVTLDLEAPPEELFIEFMRGVTSFESWARDTFPEDDPRRVHLAGPPGDRGLRRRAEYAVQFVGPFWRRVGLEMMMGITKPDLSGMLTREQSAVARYDLALLEVRQQLCALEGLPTDMEGPEEPLDPFLESPYSFSVDEGTFYSWGPDYEDDGASILYDPTNGISSSGDIFMPRREAAPQGGKDAAEPGND